MPSTPARKVCDQTILPNAYAMSEIGTQSMPCLNHSGRRWPPGQTSNNVANNVPNAATADFSVSCSINSLGTPSAGTKNIIQARARTDLSEEVGGMPSVYLERVLLECYCLRPVSSRADATEFGTLACQHTLTDIAYRSGHW
jgi:hypothetical protein